MTRDTELMYPVMSSWAGSGAVGKSRRSNEK